MKNILNIDNGIPTLLSNVDDGTNTIFINGEELPSSDWTGSGVYTFTNGGITFTIRKISNNSGNIMMQMDERSGGTSYQLVKYVSNAEKYYSIYDPAETDIADDDYIPLLDTSAGAKKKSLWSNIVNKLKSAFVPLITHTGVGETYGAGSYQWGKIAIITVTNSYIDGPIVFEVSQRKYALSIIQVSFKNSRSVDPELDYFITNNDDHYYIKKVATSTWELYAKYSEYYGGVALHRITGYRADNYVDVTVVMENIAEPTGLIQVSYGGNVESSTYVKDYGNNVPTKFGYSTAGMAQSAATWLGGWDATVSGEYRLRAVRQADLKVAHAANAVTYDEIFSGYCSAANTYQTKSLTSGKKLSDYKYIIIESRQYGNTTQVYVEAVDRFKQHNGTGNRIIMNAVTGEQYQVYYVSDTQIALSQSQISGSYLSLHIYGMIGV